jgi:hypothetical protein
MENWCWHWCKNGKINTGKHSFAQGGGLPEVATFLLSLKLRNYPCYPHQYFMALVKTKTFIQL